MLGVGKRFVIVRKNAGASTHFSKEDSLSPPTSPCPIPPHASTPRLHLPPPSPPSLASPTAHSSHSSFLARSSSPLEQTTCEGGFDDSYSEDFLPLPRVAAVVFALPEGRPGRRHRRRCEEREEAGGGRALMGAKPGGESVGLNRGRVGGAEPGEGWWG